jgi:hypothetical protein
VSTGKLSFRDRDLPHGTSLFRSPGSAPGRKKLLSSGIRRIIGRDLWWGLNCDFWSMSNEGFIQKSLIWDLRRHLAVDVRISSTWIYGSGPKKSRVGFSGSGQLTRHGLAPNSDNGRSRGALRFPSSHAQRTDSISLATFCTSVADTSLKPGGMHLTCHGTQ